MTNFDAAKQQRMLTLNQAVKMIKEGKDEEATALLTQWRDACADEVRQIAQSMADMQEEQIMAARGYRYLNAEEKAYYKQLGDAVQDPDPSAITNIEKAFPTTIIDAVLEDIQQEHPLLEAITFVNTTILTKWIYNTEGVQSAVWGPITGKIKGELEGSINAVDLTMCKLTAFMCIPIDLIDMGPSWIDLYVRMILVDALAVCIEAGVVTGTGKDEPIGMDRNVGEGAAVVSGVYPQKDAVEITEFTPEAFGPIIAGMAKTPTGRPRAVSGLIMIVSPAAYYGKIMPATTIMDASGVYHNDVLPVPVRIYQSAAITDDDIAICGMGKRYFMGVGTGGKNGRLETDDSVRFLDDQRAYKIKLLGNGKPMDNNAFVRLDISKLKPARYKVEVVDTAKASEPSEGT